MAQIHQYKRLENNLVRKIKNAVIWVVSKIGDFFVSIFKLLTRRYTIVMVPHSEKKIYNFHVSVLGIVMTFLVIIGLGGAFFWYSASSGRIRGSITEWNSELQDAELNLAQLRNEVNQLSRAARGFEAVLSNALVNMGSTPGELNLSELSSRSSPFSLIRSDDVLKEEIKDIRYLAAYLSSAVEPVKEIGDILDSQSTILSEIPSISPIKAGIPRHITAGFGINNDPFTGVPHMHTGIDFSTYRAGDPVIATADGQVTYMGYEPSGFGNYIIIRHQHGFYTRYAHLSAFRVETGQQVKQGDTIGYIGSTGRSTGPHLHYEVHIGSDYVNPDKYLNIRPNPAQ